MIDRHNRTERRRETPDCQLKAPQRAGRQRGRAAPAMVFVYEIRGGFYTYMGRCAAAPHPAAPPAAPLRAARDSPL